MHRRLATLHARRAALLRDLAVVEDEFAAALRAAADGAEQHGHKLRAVDGAA